MIRRGPPSRSSGRRTALGIAVVFALLPGLPSPDRMPRDTILPQDPPPAQRATGRAGVTALAPLPPSLASVTPDFAWSTDTGPGFSPPVSYRLRVAFDSAFETPAVDTVLLGTEQFAWRSPVKPGPPLYWQVDATAAGGASASTGRVGPIQTPEWARLLTLANPSGATTPDPQPTFTWSPSPIANPPGPFSYDVLVRQTAGGPQSTFVAGLTDTTIRLPTPLERNETYRWALVIHAGLDTSLVRAPAPFLVLDATAPPATLLYNNFPNPFPTPARDATCIWFDLALPSRVALEILDLRGGVVRRLVPSPDFPGVLPAGRYGRGAPGGGLCDPRFAWDGRTDDGRLLPAGVYLYKLKAGDVIQFKRIVYLGRTQ
jgi:hypothetical protein